MSWQPSASLSVLQQRAALYHTLRQFFLDRRVLEVDVPVLSEYATVDPFIESLQTLVLDKLAKHFVKVKKVVVTLQNSPCLNGIVLAWMNVN